jgi:hypothetical protein
MRPGKAAKIIRRKCGFVAVSWAFPVENQNKYRLSSYRTVSKILKMQHASHRFKGFSLIFLGGNPEGHASAFYIIWEFQTVQWLADFLFFTAGQCDILRLTGTLPYFLLVKPDSNRGRQLAYLTIQDR